MSQLRHPNVIALLGAIWDAKMVGILLEYASKGSLDDLIKTNELRRSNFSWSDPMLRIVTEIAMGMNYLHTTAIHDENTHDQPTSVEIT